MKPRNPWKIAFALLLALIVGVMAIGGLFRSLDWRRVANDRGWKAEQSFGYLSEPVLKTPDGKVLTRAQVLDALIANAVKQAEAPKK